MLDFWRSYHRLQRYRAEIRVVVKNTASVPKQTTLVIPVPLTTEYQTTTPVFEERTITRVLELAPGREETVSIKFQAKVRPRRASVTDPRLREANEFVIGYLTYGNAIKGLYTAEEAREKKVVDCGGFDTLLQDELAKQGIKSEVVAGFWTAGTMHAWLEIEGTIPADPSMEQLRRQGRTKKSGKLGFVGSDRIAFSIGEPFLQNAFLKTEESEITYENYFYCTRA